MRLLTGYMPKILSGTHLYESTEFSNEHELERAVVEHSDIIFGEKTVYFDVKREVRKKKGELRGRPDGYLISLSGGSPKLFIVENEVSEHDELDIGQQLMKYQATFREGQYNTKTILQREVKDNKSVSRAVERMLKEASFPNASELFDEVIFRQPPGYIVVIDEASERLREVLKVLESPPEVVEIKKYVSSEGTMYYFSDFEFAQVRQSTSKRLSTLSEVDTIVCPARPRGFANVFLGQDRWYAIRMSAAMIPQIKYIAMYETKPYSGIRWIGHVQDIKPYQDSDKFDVIISKREKLDNPIKLTPDEYRRGMQPRGPKYTKMELIRKAKTLSDIF
jgi:hypothetical protein